MQKSLKKHLYKFIPALLLCLSFLFLSGTETKNSAFFAEQEVLILWTTPISAQEAEIHLSALCSDLIISEHSDDFSICKNTAGPVPSSVLSALNASPHIRVAELSSVATLWSSPETASHFNGQWAFHNTGDYIYYINDIPIQRTSTPDVDINLPEAYAYLEEHPATHEVTVAVIDTGVDILHPALSNHIWINRNEIPDNGMDDDRNGYVDDCYGWDFYNNDNTVCHYVTTTHGQTNANPEDNDNHGTHCAGIIAATGDVFGVAGGINIRILPLKIHGGLKNSGSVSQAIKAIKYAQAAGAKICNLSWGTTVYSEILETVMRESDMLFVVAAGNSGGNNNSTPLYPASYSLDNMISVAYVTQSGTLASDSNYGVSTVDIAAPGQDIYSTTVGGEYHYLSGTSMAAPVVSGVAALLYAVTDAPYPQTVKEVLLQTLKPLESLEGFIRYPGIVDAAAALSAAEHIASDTIAPTLSADTSFEESSLLVSVTAEDLGGSGLRVVRFALGALDAAYFRNGTLGNPVERSTITFHRSGTYTFYAADYAGNETTLVYAIPDDTVPPELSAVYTENPDGTFTVTVSATDGESGLKRLRYLSGTHGEQHFLSAGTDLPTDSVCTFIADSEQRYTICATDYRGNKTLTYLDVKKVPAEQLYLNALERTLQIGETYQLLPLLLPYTATDYLFFTVNDETLLHASADGLLTALAPGSASVTVSTTGGLVKECIIHIQEPSS